MIIFVILLLYNDKIDVKINDVNKKIKDLLYIIFNIIINKFNFINLYLNIFLRNKKTDKKVCFIFL